MRILTLEDQDWNNLILENKGMDLLCGEGQSIMLKVLMKMIKRERIYSQVKASLGSREGSVASSETG